MEATTPRYTSPEILMGIGRHSKESDVFAFGMVMIEVGGNEFAPSQITLSFGEGFHNQSPVQQLNFLRSRSDDHAGGTSGATHSPQLDGAPVEIGPTVLDGESPRPPQDGSSDRAAVSFFSPHGECSTH